MQLLCEPRTALSCPLCQSPSRRRFAKDSIWIRDCLCCDHRFAEFELSEGHVESTYSDEYFFGGGAGYSDYTSESDILRSHGRRYAQIIEPFVAPGELLDVGAAAGFVMRGFIDAGWNGIGIEPNARMAKLARDELGLEVHAATIEEFAPDRRFDLVTMIQVIAHFPEPRAALEVVANLTRPGGFCLVETWNRASLTARVFGKSWHEYSPPSVLHWFSRSSLRLLLANSGFHEVASGRPVKRLNAAHAKSLLSHKWKDSRLGRMATRLANLAPDAMPIPYPAEDLIWSLFQRTY